MANAAFRVHPQAAFETLSGQLHRTRSGASRRAGHFRDTRWTPKGGSATSASIISSGGVDATQEASRLPRCCPAAHAGRVLSKLAGLAYAATADARALGAATRPAHPSRSWPVPVTAITPVIVRNWHGGLDPKTPTYRAHAYSLLKSILTTAFAEQLITRSRAWFAAGPARDCSQEPPGHAGGADHHHRAHVQPVAAGCADRRLVRTPLRRNLRAATR